jgi:hypothetical protein
MIKVKQQSEDDNKSTFSGFFGGSTKKDKGK